MLAFIAFNACAYRDKHSKTNRACRSKPELLAAITPIPAIFVFALKVNDFE